MKFYIFGQLALKSQFEYNYILLYAKCIKYFSAAIYANFKKPVVELNNASNKRGHQQTTLTKAPRPSPTRHTEKLKRLAVIVAQEPTEPFVTFYESASQSKTIAVSVNSYFSTIRE